MKMLLLLIPLLAACSSTSITRNPDGSLQADHRTLFMKVESPSIEVEKGDDYKAKYNAKSRSGELDLGALRDIIQLGISGKTDDG